MNWYDLIKTASLNVSVETANSYGELVLYINGKKYEYQLPYTASDTGRDIMMFMRKNNLPKVSKYIKWLDQYIVNKPPTEQK